MRQRKHLLRRSLCFAIITPAKIRKAVYADFEQPAFRRRLMAAAREYEGRVFGTSLRPRNCQLAGSASGVVSPASLWVDILINPWYKLLMEFGQLLRQLRTKTGIGIKRLAPELRVSYTYLSKLENNEINPSAELVDRVAKYFDYNRDALLLSAGKIPQEILEILRENPDDALKFLRERFGAKNGARRRP